jgi:hypothetical protein
LKEQIQRRKEERKRELDHDDWVTRQKRELVALRLQRVIQNNDEKRSGARIDLQEESKEPYNPDSGFVLFWDFAVGVPAAENDLQVGLPSTKPSYETVLTYFLLFRSLTLYLRGKLLGHRSKLSLRKRPKRSVRSTNASPFSLLVTLRKLLRRQIYELSWRYDCSRKSVVFLSTSSLVFYAEGGVGSSKPCWWLANSNEFRLGSI